MSEALFWGCFGGYLLVGVLATFGFEICVESRGNAARKNVMYLFAGATAINFFLIPLVSDMIQGNSLSLSQSDAITEAGNFLGPLDQVFQFLEDGVTVRIAAALGGGDFATAGSLIKIAVMAGLGSGVVAAVVMIPLAFIEPLFAFFVPFSNSVKAPIGCTIGPTATKLQGYARPYWILSALALPFAFASKCSLAFFLGSQSFFTWGLIGIASGGVGLGLTYVFLDVLDLGTVGVGLNGVIVAPLFVGITIAFLCTKSMREKYHFTSWKLPKDSYVLLVRCARDGVTLMIKDLLSSIAGNLPSMFAAHLSLTLQYSLTLISTVGGRFNVFATFLALMGRLRGARLLGGGENVEFRKFAHKLIAQGLAVGLAASLAAAIGSSVLPFAFASDSLKDLKHHPCSHGLYDSVKDNANGGAYWLMCIGLLVSSLGTVYSALLYAFRDFSLLLKLEVFNFVVGVPLVVFAYLSVRTLFAIYLASSFTGFITLGVYIWRLHFVLLRRLPKFDTVEEAALLPEHSSHGARDPSTGKRTDSLLDMATEDLTRLLLPRDAIHSWDAAVNASANHRPQSVPNRSQRPKSYGGWSSTPSQPARPASMGIRRRATTNSTGAAADYVPPSMQAVVEHPASGDASPVGADAKQDSSPHSPRP